MSADLTSHAGSITKVQFSVQDFVTWMPFWEEMTGWWQSWLMRQIK